jgi:hypothetical protein
MKSLSQINLTTIVIVSIITLSTALLIGFRFDAIWAGGNGYQTHQSAYDVAETEYKRGETVSSGEEELIYLELGESSIWLDKNTEVKLIDGRAGHLRIDVIQGRVIVIGELEIQTRELITTVSGTTTLIHYSWLDELEITAIDGSTLVTAPQMSTIPLDNQITYQFDTLSPYFFETSGAFNPNNSEAAKFYDQILSGDVFLD